MKKELKAQVIESISAQLSEYSDFYITDIAGLNAGQTSKLRRECFNEGISLNVVKNTLFIKALDAAETDFTPLYDSLKGTSSILFTEVANVPGKMLKKNPKSGIKALKAAYAEGGFYSADQLDALAALKSKEELIADVVALLQSPIKNVVSALQSGGNNIHGVLKTLSERA